MATGHYGRARFIANLLPLIRRATALRRVVSVLSGTYEGAIDTTDWQALRLSFPRMNGHVASLVTLTLEAFAREAPEVAFVHDHPGPVVTNIARPGQGYFVAFLNVIFQTIMRLPFVGIPIAQSGAWHAYFATSARYPPAQREVAEAADGVPLGEGAAVARGTGGTNGSGVYSIQWYGESAAPKVEALLEKYRQDGMANQVWENLQEEFRRITGSASIE